MAETVSTGWRTRLTAIGRRTAQRSHSRWSAVFGAIYALLARVRVRSLSVLRRRVQPGAPGRAVRARAPQGSGARAHRMAAHRSRRPRSLHPVEVPAGRAGVARARSASGGRVAGHATRSGRRARARVAHDAALARPAAGIGRADHARDRAAVRDGGGLVLHAHAGADVSRDRVRGGRFVGRVAALRLARALPARRSGARS